MVEVLAQLTNPKWVIFGVWGDKFVVLHAESEDEFRKVVKQIDWVVGVIDEWGNLWGCDGFVDVDGMLRDGEIVS